MKKIKIKILKIFILIISIFMTSCISNHIMQKPLLDVNSKTISETKTNQGKSQLDNVLIDIDLKKIYGEEWKYNKNEKERPQFGLALSGGGVRSASYCIGVMKGLNETGILDTIDVISSVSGGSYASYWFYMQHYYMDTIKGFTTGDIFRTTADIFCIKDKVIENNKKKDNSLLNVDDYKFQYKLEKTSKTTELFSSKWYHKYLLFPPIDYFLKPIVSQLISIPFHFVFNGLFDAEADWATPYKKYYNNGIQRTYGLVPLDGELKKYANEKGPFGLPIWSEKITLEDMQMFLYERNRDTSLVKLPFFIINTTSDYSNYRAFCNDNKSMIDRIYEFTPISFGSNRFGYVKRPSLLSKFDFNDLIVTSGSAADGQSDKASKIVKILMNIFNFDIGIYYKNYGYYDNSNAIAMWAHKFIPFPLYFLDDIYKPLRTIKLSDGGHSENIGLMSLIRRGVKNIIVVDAEYDPTAIFKSAKKLQIVLKDSMGLIFSLELPETGFFIDDAPNPIIKGTIKTKDSVVFINIAYVKLSKDKSKIEKLEYNENVVEYAIHNKNFPMAKTFDTHFSPKQFKAYRDLGYYTIKDNLDILKEFINLENHKIIKKSEKK